MFEFRQVSGIYCLVERLFVLQGMCFVELVGQSQKTNKFRNCLYSVPVDVTILFDCTIAVLLTRPIFGQFNYTSNEFSH